jgi:ubiquinone/menaquinone biosynthesis C-methylase UbiE
MNSSRRHRSATQGATDKQTKGLVLAGGARYDLHTWLIDSILFRRQGRQLRRRTIQLAGLRQGERVLDVGCGTGTLAIEAARIVGGAGRVVGVDPGIQQIARARTKAARRHATVAFEVGVIERLAFPDQTFDVALSTLMMHHLPASLKRQGLAEIARVLRPGGRLVIADFTHPRERTGRAARFHAGGSNRQGLIDLVTESGFTDVAAEELRPLRFSAFPGATIVTASRS